MSAPQRAGWYWAKCGIIWEIVFYSKINNYVARSGYPLPFKVEDFEQWGDRIERKEPIK